MASRLKQRASDFSHAIIGGGVVGMAIAARLSAVSRNSVLLLERHGSLGTETSSRNSEVIHAGIYYPPDSLRTKLCIRGKQLLYQLSEKSHGAVEMKKCGKWIVAQTDSEMEYLTKLFQRAKTIDVPLEWLSIDKAKSEEPAVIARKGILHSPTTGIISAHSLMNYLEGAMESNSCTVSLMTEVTGIDHLGDSNGYILTCKTTESGEETTIKSDIVINCAGLNAPIVSNLVLPKERHLKAYYGKGNYFSYGLSSPKVSRLIYPCPTSQASLGTHLTIDLAGQIRFGPDLEWVEDPNDYSVSSANLGPALEEIQRYISIDPAGVTPAYSGIRPKLTNNPSEFADFIIRKEQGFPGFVNLLSIESPGLTASLAIAEYVDNLVM